MPDPITGEGFDAPTPEVVYMGAPDVVQEAADLTRISTLLHAEATEASVRGVPFDPEEHAGRLYLLRRAALADRLSLAYPEVEEFLTDAVQLSQKLAAYDRKHGTHTGPIGPDAIEWDPSTRPYVRQEYDRLEMVTTNMDTSIRQFMATLLKLVETYPTDVEGTATVTVTVTDPETGEEHQVHVQPGQLDIMTAAVVGELGTFRNGHSDGNGLCGHCHGSGRVRP